MSREELKPCAHCGGEAEVQTAGVLHLVVCKSCGMKSANYASNLRAEAIAAWNRRAQDVAPILYNDHDRFLFEAACECMSPDQMTAFERAIVDDDLRRRFANCVRKRLGAQDVVRAPEGFVDILFDGPPQHESGRFVEVENSAGMSIKLGEWIQRGDGYFALRIQLSELAAAPAAPAVAPHPDDEAVDRFAAAMKEKLAESRAKGRGGWQQCDPVELSIMLREHVEKGDPRDVANFCMFLWHHGKPISDAALPMGKRAAPAQAEQQGEGGADKAEQWKALFDRMALELMCLPSSFVNGNDHVFRALEKLTRLKQPSARMALSGERIEAVVILATKHISDNLIRMQVDKEVRAILAASVAQTGESK